MDGWQGDSSDEQFYGQGISIIDGLRAAAPEDTEVTYMPGFSIEGEDINLDEVLTAADDYDTIVACIGERVYSEGIVLHYIHG